MIVNSQNNVPDASKILCVPGWSVYLPFFFAFFSLNLFSAVKTGSKTC